MFRRISTLLQRLVSSREGSVALQIGIGLAVLAGTVGLGTEGTVLIYKHRQMQSAADSAALSGAMALTQVYPRDPQSEARAVAARLGFVHGADEVNVTVNVPPLSGGQAGNAGAVEVVISQPQDLAMLRMFGGDSVNVGTRSVATRSATGRFCVLALDMTANQSMYVSNNAALTDPNCGVAVNSNSATALVMNNNAFINGPAITRGAFSLANNAHIYGEPRIEHGTAIADPYADIQLQTPPACTGQSGSGSNNVTRNLTPGRFCSGWDFKNNVTLNLAPGTYYIDSQLSLKNNVVVNATGGVTLVVNGDYAIDIANNATINLTAPTSGDYAGMAFFGRRDATSTVLQKFSNNAILNIEGAIYFPNQILEIDNNGTTHPNGCTHAVARKIQFMNNVALGNNCDGTGVKPIGPPPQLVE
jgi:hypothetical protein